MEPLIDLSLVEPGIASESYLRDNRDLSSLMLLGSQPLKNRGYPGPFLDTRGYPTQQPVQQSVVGTYFECGEPHFLRDYPNGKQPTRISPVTSTTTIPWISPLEQYCLGCSVEHFSKDYLLKSGDASTPQKKLSLNIVTVIPSPTTSEN